MDVDFKGAGVGRAAQEATTLNRSNAYNAWVGASPEQKSKLAQAFMSHIGAMGAKLSDLVAKGELTEELAQQLRSDAGLAT